MKLPHSPMNFRPSPGTLGPRPRSAGAERRDVVPSASLFNDERRPVRGTAGAELSVDVADMGHSARPFRPFGDGRCLGGPSPRASATVPCVRATRRAVPRLTSLQTLRYQGRVGLKRTPSGCTTFRSFVCGGIRWYPAKIPIAAGPPSAPFIYS